MSRDVASSIPDDHQLLAGDGGRILRLVRVELEVEYLVGHRVRYPAG